jgi:signal transduction histidine kinase
MTDKNITAYKVIISIIFGLLGFAVNFYSLDFVFYGSYKMSFLLGLIFPMLITLAWGWRYGLLSALCGGCQTMWILWMPQSGYGSFVSVPPFTLWIVWHGWFSRTKYNIYLRELIFRVFNTAHVTHSIVFKEVVNGLLIIFIAQGLLYSFKPCKGILKAAKEHSRSALVLYLYKCRNSRWNNDLQFCG